MEFKVSFSTMAYKLEFKYDTNYIKAFTFKQLACYVHYEGLDVYKQHSLRILGITQIPNPTCATPIAIASHETTIVHHGTMPNNPDLVPTSINLSPQQLTVVIANIPPTIDALAFVDLMGEYF